jgi:feruloyl esterase
LIDYALGFDLARDTPRIFAKAEPYRQSAMEFMTPPDPAGMESFVRRGGKLIVVHGAADPVFSLLDSIRWYEGFTARHGSAARASARLFVVPGMNHSRGGPATDQFDMVDALVAWVERGVAPEAVVATARGPGAAVVNSEIPASWSPARTRLLCAYPNVARYRGKDDVEDAGSFQCQMP